jgi:multicomponent Na+:H+ antiporter subunit D
MSAILLPAIVATLSGLDPEVIPPVLVALPLVTAALLSGAERFIPERVADIAGALAAAVVTFLAIELLIATLDGPAVHWIGGWGPREGTAIGIALLGDPMSASIVAVSGVLSVAAFAYVFRYYDTLGTLYHALALVVLGGLSGFVLTADLFSLFVFLKLMSIAAYALTAYEVEERAPLHAGLTFAVTNSVGGFVLLFGVGIVYAVTGVLDYAQAGELLGDVPVDVLLVFAMVTITSGLLVKGAIVPFHFWQPDAYAAAPTPILALFAGMMTKAALYVFARLHWTVFAGAVGESPTALRTTLLVLGVVTALWGAVMTSLQSNLKRLLAFASLAHIGVILIGIATLTGEGLAGALLYGIGHAGVMAALFLLAGMLLHRHRTLEDTELFGRVRDMPLVGFTFVIAALALAGVPPGGLHAGKVFIEEALEGVGSYWAVPVLWAVHVLTGAAVLRATARAFLGWGDPGRLPGAGERSFEEPGAESAPARAAVPMFVPAVLLLLGGIVVGVPGSIHAIAEHAGERVTDREGYVAVLLEGEEGPTAAALEPDEDVFKADSVAESAALGAGAVVLAVLVIGSGRLTGDPGRIRERVLEPAAVGLRSVQSGDLGDYVAWYTIGTAALGVALVAGLT